MNEQRSLIVICENATRELLRCHLAGFDLTFYELSQSRATRFQLELDWNRVCVVEADLASTDLTRLRSINQGNLLLPFVVVSPRSRNLLTQYAVAIQNGAEAIFFLHDLDSEEFRQVLENAFARLGRWREAIESSSVVI